MAWRLAVSMFIGSVWISAIAASTDGISDRYLEERTQLLGGNCSSLTNIQATCWSQLQITKYLSQWVGAHQTCKTGGSVTDCCITGEPWSTCFMRVAYGSRYATYGMNCTEFNGCREPPLAPSLPDGITIQDFYILNGIYAMNALFSELNEWLLSVAAAGKFLPDLEQVGTLNTSQLAVAFSAGLPFLAYTTFAPGIPQPPAGLTIQQQFVLQTFLESLLSTPEFSNTVWPAKSPPPETPPTILSNNATLPSPTAAIATGLNITLSSVPTFLEFTESGAWTATYPAAAALPNITTPWLALANGATTYAYSTVLAQNNFYALSLGIEEDQTLYQQDKSCTPAGYVCTSSTNLAPAAAPVPNDAPGQNYTYYWSPVTHRQYQFLYNGTASNNENTTDPYTVLQGVETSGTSLPVFFDGAYTCAAEGRRGKNILGVNEDGSLDFNCFSGLFVKFQVQA